MTDPDGDRRALPPLWAVLLVVVAVAGVAFAIGRFSTFGALGAGTVPTRPLYISYAVFCLKKI